MTAAFGGARALHCSFCAKSELEVAKLAAGPGVLICDQCVAICATVMEANDAERTSGPVQLAWPRDAPTETLLSLLQGQQAATEEIGARLRATIDALRLREVSWERIGKALGCSRQAAWERFG